MEVEEKIILTKSEMIGLVEDAVQAGINTGEADVFKDYPNYRKVDLAYQKFLDNLPTNVRLKFEDR